MKLSFTVVEIEEHDGFSVLWVNVSATDPALYASGSFGVQVSPEVAAQNTVGQELVM